MKLLLEKYKWYSRDKISVTGFILEGDHLIKSESLADHFTGLNSVNDFRNKLILANGQFSVIIERENETWAACDRLRCYPLFYRKDADNIVICDNSYTCLKDGDSIDELMADAFIASGYVPGNKTLVSNIYQIEAGSYVVVGDTASSEFYHSLYDSQVNGLNPPPSGKNLADKLDQVFSAHLNSLNDKFIAVSLSGGYDSRLAALMAAKYHPANLIFFTFGRAGNIESCKAERVAARLGVKWINIEYNDKLIKGFVNDPVFRDYYPYASGLTSMFYLSDYFAVKYLKDNNLIPENTVFIPGHSGDFLAGSHLYRKLNKSLPDNDIAKAIYSHYFTNIKLGKNKELVIREVINEHIPERSERSWLVYENWIMKERQSKFIVNSANVYKYFGYDFVLPFWDKSLIDFFSALPFNLKYNKLLYDNVLKNTFFHDRGLCFTDDPDFTSGIKRFQKIKDAIKPLLPYRFVSMLLNHKSGVYYDHITTMLRDDMGKENVIRPVQSNYFNSYIIQWYLYNTRALLSGRMTRN